ncbi:MAG: hypothetical protein RQ838_03220 [Caldivirga sp.]|nr:hypothetical protein [Caldivirga sp.]
MGTCMGGETQTSEPVLERRRLQMASENIIRIPRQQLAWKLPLVYIIERIERNGDRVTITIRVVKEGGVNE